MQFNDKDKAQDGKVRLLQINQDFKGHQINDKKVDVKSADDFVKPSPGQAPMPQMHQ